MTLYARGCEHCGIGFYTHEGPQYPGGGANPLYPSQEPKPIACADCVRVRAKKLKTCQFLCRCTGSAACAASDEPPRRCRIRRGEAFA